MCGIYGTINGQVEPIAAKILKRIIVNTETRGNDAYGFSWVDRKGSLHMHKGKGTASENGFPHLNRLRYARYLIGHTRFTTHGDEAINKNNHPHKSGKGYIVHNGVIFNYRSLARTKKIALKTECDSEIIGSLIAYYSGKGKNLADSVKSAMDDLDGKAAIASLHYRNGKPILTLAKSDNPICFVQTTKRIYFSSLGVGFPTKKVFKFNDDTLIQFQIDEKQNVQQIAKRDLMVSVPYSNDYDSWSGLTYGHGKWFICDLCHEASNTIRKVSNMNICKDCCEVYGDNADDTLTPKTWQMCEKCRTMFELTDSRDVLCNKCFQKTIYDPDCPIPQVADNLKDVPKGSIILGRGKGYVEYVPCGSKVD